MGAKTEAAAVTLAAKATASPAAIAPLLQGTTHRVRRPRGAPGIRDRLLRGEQAKNANVL